MKAFSLYSFVLEFLVLMIFWCFLSGFFDLLHLGIGAACVLLVMFIHHNLFRHAFSRDDVDFLQELKLARLIPYIGWLGIQIIVSGLRVVVVILGEKSRVQTSIVKFRANLPNAQARVILGNSITLTPGTLTLDIDDDLFTVHALTPESYEGIVNGDMPRRVLRLFQSAEYPVVSEVSIQGKESGVS